MGPVNVRHTLIINFNKNFMKNLKKKNCQKVSYFFIKNFLNDLLMYVVCF